MAIEGKASARWIRITPRKVRLVADLVRGKPVRDAVNTLHFSLKSASLPVEKVVRSALANLMQQEAGGKLDPADVVIKDIQVDEGPTTRRWMPRAMGRAYRIRKKSSHIRVVLSAPGPVAKGKQAASK